MPEKVLTADPYLDPRSCLSHSSTNANCQKGLTQGLESQSGLSGTELLEHKVK